MKTLILCVDRDDDLGAKARQESPIVGRRANVEAATALGLADPEDSDTNAIFAAVHLYDKQRRQMRPDDQVEVATITGHPRMGVRGDRKLARELEEVLDQTRADEVIVVSDGAEDERIMPIIQSHIRVAHVHRSVVKQAPRLEGFYYVLTRMLDDRKQALRFVLPVGIILAVWGGARLAGWEQYATGATLAIAGMWLIVHAMKWEDAVGRFFHDIGEGVRSGKVGLVAIIVMIITLILGALKAQEVAPLTRDAGGIDVLRFADAYLPWVVGGLLIMTLGQLFDAWFRHGRAGISLWRRAVALVAFLLIGSVVLDVAVEYLQGHGLGRLSDFDLVLRLMAGLFMAMGGMLLARYLRSVFRPTAGTR